MAAEIKKTGVYSYLFYAQNVLPRRRNGLPHLRPGGDNLPLRFFRPQNRQCGPIHPAASVLRQLAQSNKSVGNHEWRQLAMEVAVQLVLRQFLSLARDDINAQFTIRTYNRRCLPQAFIARQSSLDLSQFYEAPFKLCPVVKSAQKLNRSILPVPGTMASGQTRPPRLR